MRADATCVNCLYAQQYDRVKARPEKEKKTERDSNQNPAAGIIFFEEEK